ncbi:GntR family trehalose operon transcriptional repressor [Virgibacillus natechei]|uniref:Trehalose operon repressor n=1 Tax=Virgibacillus natechei TaxID=1216297 RepID=A0ABS4ICF4_9BACI|nr:trehalose operon repressor [Virgibacillus natechei]MBP1968627.1 GntR family trehalose operon transcriptional repressor [Virgibacillus natechei]UZD13733.1 trehalose operon repressor [Virgibacillus natechei]
MQKKYLTIYHELVKKIESNTWAKSTMLPSENELTDMYQTSRETIRKALNLLAQNGYIQKIRGKGSVVIDVNTLDFPVSGIVSFKEIAENQQLSTKTFVHARAFLEQGNEMQTKLNTLNRERIWKVVRVREISGEKVIVDNDFFVEKYVPMLSEEICEDSIYRYIEDELELVISFGNKEITVEEPTDEDRELLDLDGFTNVVVIRSLVYLEDASLFQYTESRHRPDKFRFVDFARRIQNK